MGVDLMVFTARASSFSDIDFVDASEIQEAADDDGAVCKACFASRSTPTNLPSKRMTRMIGRTKCEFCHAVHLLVFGESSWKDIFSCGNLCMLHVVNMKQESNIFKLTMAKLDCCPVLLGLIWYGHGLYVWSLI